MDPEQEQDQEQEQDREQEQECESAQEQEEQCAYFICSEPGCKAAFYTYQSLGGHYLKTHSKKAPDEKDCGTDVLPWGYTLRGKPGKDWKPPKALAHTPSVKGEVKKAMSENSPSQSVYREATEPNTILRELLSTYPGLSEGHVKEIMSWADMQGSLHPMEVAHLLDAMAQVPKGADKIIPQKYSLALQKAAGEGKHDVQVTMGRWQSQGLPQTGNFPGMMFGPNQGLWAPPPWLGSGIPPNLMGGPGGYNFMGTGFANREPTLEDKARDLRMDAIEAAQARILQGMSDLVNKITESEQEKKEAALRAEIQGLRDSVVALTTNPKRDDEQSPILEKVLDQLKETQSKIGELREEQANTRIASMEQHIASLESLIKQSQGDQLKRLQEELDSTKSTLTNTIEQIKTPKTGQNEYDVLSKAVDKAAEVIGDAGKTARAFVMRNQTAQDFNPTRVNPKERRELGERLADTIESEASLRAAERDFLG